MHRVLRWVLGLIGLGLLTFAMVQAWRSADGATTVAFLAAGVILVLVAAFPRLPSEIGVGGGSLKYAEEKVAREFSQRVEAGIDELVFEEQMRENDDWARAHPGEAEGRTGGGLGTWEADLETARQHARAATTALELADAFDIARRAADERVAALRQIIERRRNS